MSITYRIKALLGYDQSKLDTQVHQKNSGKLIAAYLQHHTQRKLQIGAQGSPMPGWLNVDILPKTTDTAYMDATQKFPFGDDIFDFVFAEHMIEHIDFEQARFMLQECCRTLKTGGVIRLATPNLDNIPSLLAEPEKPEHQEYVKYYIERFYPKGYPMLPALQINKLFYGFHHRFIHNFESLAYLLTQAGFKNITRCAVYQSRHQPLQNLEKHAKMMGEANNLLETFVVEAEK